MSSIKKVMPLHANETPPKDCLAVEGLRENNLKNLSISIPHERITAVVGPSGSGKSSLAFDTLFAEGRWRFMESLSTYTRLFLDKMERPDVDA
ncbi:MAG: ATP-binding cassette domain-containing protein, partial [Thermodesulfobacteriota bacterium]